MIHSVLLMGQSNMAGRGALDEVPMFDNALMRVLRNGRWQKLYRPVNPDRSFSGVCLAESFADLYVQNHPDVKIGLIPAADGGTSISQWAPGGLLYDHALYQAKLAERTSTIVAILWHQGESDVTTESLEYEEKLYQMAASFRKEAGLTDVPFIAGALGDFLPLYSEKATGYRLINEATRRAVSRLPLSGFVSADGLTSKPDHLHFNSASLMEFGERYYRVFETLEVKDRVFIEKPSPDDAFRTAMEEL